MEAANETDIEKGPIKKGVTFDENEEERASSKRKKTSCTSFIKNRSSELDEIDSDGKKRSIDAHRIQSALHDAVVYSYGILAAEVFVYEEKGGANEGVGIPMLTQPAGGWYCDDHYRSTITSFDNTGLGDNDDYKKDKSNKIEALARLENDTRDDYIPPGPVTPGVDLAGVLWSQYGGKSKGTEEKKGNLRSSFSMRRLSISAQSENDHQDKDNKGEENKKSTFSSPKSVRKLMKSKSFGSPKFSRSAKHVEDPKGEHESTQYKSSPSLSLPFRDLESLLNDPDTAKSGPRLKTLLRAGFANALAIPFHVGEYSGIVIYYARANVLLDEHVFSIENSTFLHKSADIIGLIISSIDSRRASVVMKHEICACVCQRVRNNIACRAKKTAITIQGKKPSLSSSVLSTVQAHRQVVKDQIKTYIRKCWYGGNNQIPPPMPLKQTIYTWIGAFLGLLLLSGMNELAIEYSDGDYSLLIGPFGALMTLMYGLSSAPASQPRNAILGQVVAGSISLCFTYIPEENLSVWVRRALGPAFSITAMVALGIPHPPAGAHSVLYASGDYDWTFYLLVVIGSIISVFPATLVNNLSEKRQYPTYWGYWTNFLPRWEGSKNTSDAGRGSVFCCNRQISEEGEKKITKVAKHTK